MPSPFASPLALTPSAHISHSREQSRFTSPVRYNIAHFQDIHLTHPATARTARDSTRYCPEPSPHEDFRNSQPGESYRAITDAFLGKLPLIAQATNIHSIAPPSDCSLPASGTYSPTKSLASFITSNTSDNTARKRTRHTSKSVIDNWFNGTSAPLNIGILPSPTRSTSPEPEEYDIDLAYGNSMDFAVGSSYTRSPRARRSRTSTMQSQTSSPGVAGRLGGWFASKSSPAPKADRPMQGISPSDPLLTLDINQALFPHGPADPLDPTSFNDLLMAAEAVIATMQSAYRARCAELRDLRSEISVKDDEVEEAETRARHLKMQLEGMAGQVAAQEAKTEMLEKMLEQQQRETKELRRQSSEQGSRKVSLKIVASHDQDVRNWKRTTRSGESDSGFESDGDNDSVFSLQSPISSSASTVESETVHAEAEKVRMVRVERGRDTIFPPNVAKAYAPLEMRIENQRLRERVQELEQAVEGCLDLVSGSWPTR